MTNIIPCASIVTTHFCYVKGFLLEFWLHLLWPLVSKSVYNVFYLFSYILLLYFFYDVLLRCWLSRNHLMFHVSLISTYILYFTSFITNIIPYPPIFTMIFCFAIGFLLEFWLHLLWPLVSKSVHNVFHIFYCCTFWWRVSQMLIESESLDVAC